MNASHASPSVRRGITHGPGQASGPSRLRCAPTQPRREMRSSSLGQEQQLSLDVLTAAGFPGKTIQYDSPCRHAITDFQLCSRPSSLLHLLLANKHLPTKPQHKHVPQTGNHKKSNPEHYHHTNLVSRDKIAHNVLTATKNSSLSHSKVLKIELISIKKYLK